MIDCDAPAAPRRLADLAFTADELKIGQAPARAWHVRNMVPKRAVTLLQGDGGTGKSILALQLAAATVSGGRWLGHEVHEGRVLYLSAEDDRDEIHRRLDAVTLDHDYASDGLAGLKVLDVTSEDSVLAVADRTGRLTATERWREFEAIALSWQPALIVLDNLADVFAGEENSRPQARQFVSLLQACAARCDASLLLIGHPSLQGMASGTGSSGSTAWNNSVRSRLYLTRPPPEEDAPSSPDERILRVVKANYAPSGGEMRLRWAGGSFVAETGAAPAMGAVDRASAHAKAERVFLSLLDAFTQEARWVGHNTGHTYAPALFAKDPRAEGLGKPTLAAAMGRLFAAGRIVVEPYGPPSKDKRRIARAAEVEVA